MHWSQLIGMHSGFSGNQRFPILLSSNKFEMHLRRHQLNHTKWAQESGQEQIKFQPCFASVDASKQATRHICGLWNQPESATLSVLSAAVEQIWVIRTVIPVDKVDLPDVVWIRKDDLLCEDTLQMVPTWCHMHRDGQVLLVTRCYAIAWRSPMESPVSVTPLEL